MGVTNWSHIDLNPNHSVTEVTTVTTVDTVYESIHAYKTRSSKT